MKKEKRINLEPDIWGRLKQKANDRGYYGKSWLSNWLIMLSKTAIIYSDSNAESLVKMFGTIINKQDEN